MAPQDSVAQSTSTTTQVISTTAPASTITAIPTTFFMYSNTTIYAEWQDASSNAIQSYLSGGPHGSVVLKGPLYGFDPFFGVTATSPPAVVNVQDYLTAMGVQDGQQAEIRRSGSQDPMPITTSSSLFPLSTGDLLLIPYSQVGYIPTSFDVAGQYSILNRVPQTALYTPSSTIATPGPMTTVPMQSSDPGPGKNVGAIAGGVVGGLAGLAIVMTGIFLFWRRQRTAHPRTESGPFLSQIGQPESPSFEQQQFLGRSGGGGGRQSGAW